MRRSHFVSNSNGLYIPHKHKTEQHSLPDPAFSSSYIRSTLCIVYIHVFLMRQNTRYLFASSTSCSKPVNINCVAESTLSSKNLIISYNRACRTPGKLRRALKLPASKAAPGDRRTIDVSKISLLFHNNNLPLPDTHVFWL